MSSYITSLNNALSTIEELTNSSGGDSVMNVSGGSVDASALKASAQKAKSALEDLVNNLEYIQEDLRWKDYQ